MKRYDSIRRLNFQRARGIPAGSAPPRVMIKIFFSKFTKILLAVLGGNALYYFLEDHLPGVFHHKIFALDWGLLLDFGLCVLLWMTLDLLNKLRLRRKR